MEILKCPHGPLNYTKYPQRQSFFFSETKSVIWLYLKIGKNLNTLVEESQRNVYPLAKIYETKSETTITIHSNMPDPRCVGLAWVSDPSVLGLIDMPTQGTWEWQICMIWQITTKMTIMHFSSQERKKMQTINHCRQSDHYLSTCTTLCGREHNCASNYTANDQIWPLESVIYASLMAQAPPTR